MPRINCLHHSVADLQVFGQFVAVVNAPIHEIGVGENSSVSRRLRLAPLSERPVPGFIKVVECAVLQLQPFAKPGYAAWAIAEHRFGLVSNSRPVKCSRLAPQIPSVKCSAPHGVARDFLKESQDRFANSGMIEAVSRSCLPGNRLAILSAVTPIRILLSYPLGSRIDIDLNDNF